MANIKAAVRELESLKAVNGTSIENLQTKDLKTRFGELVVQDEPMFNGIQELEDWCNTLTNRQKNNVKNHFHWFALAHERLSVKAVKNRPAKSNEAVESEQNENTQFDITKIDRDLTQSEAATILKIAPIVVFKLVKAGQLVKNDKLITKESLVEYIKSKQEIGASNESLSDGLKVEKAEELVQV